MTLPLFLLIAAAVLSLIVGSVVLARDYRKLENISFFGLSIGIAVWSIGIAGFLNTADVVAALPWAKIYYIAPIVIVCASILFAERFVARMRFNRWANAVVLITGVTFASLISFGDGFLISEIVTRSYGKQVELDPLEYALYGGYLLLCFTLVIGVMISKLRRVSEQVERQQILFFTVGFVISCSLGIFFNLLLPGLGNYELIAIGPVSTTALIISVSYAIVRHKLFDVRLVVARTIGYAFSLLVISIVYGFVVFGLTSLVFDSDLPLSAQIYLSLATAFAGLLFARFKPVFDRITNGLFYRDAYDPQDLFDHLNRVLVSTLDIDRLMKQSAMVISGSLKAQYCVIGLREVRGQGVRIAGSSQRSFNIDDIMRVRRLTTKYHDTVIIADQLGSEHKELKALLVANDVAVLVRLSPNVRRTEEGLGYIALGPKKSGNPYAIADAKVLDTIAKELIIATQNALRFEEIESFNATLQAKVDEATRKLRRTNEKLKALDEAKDDFVSMASHQLRTPLTSIKGYTSMVLEGDAGKINATQRKLLEQSFFSSQRMVYLIADLLNVSRLKTGKFIIEPVPVNLAEVVEQEIGQLQDVASGRSLELSYEMPKDFPALLLDETKTRQVIMNFIDNAIYYTPAGGHIRVQLNETLASVELRVVDDGIGVPRAEQPHLFTKFYRAGNARKARPDGTGLGLFMAKKVIVAEGGAIIFETEEGKGSTFGFVFPKTKLAEAPKPTTPVTTSKT